MNANNLKHKLIEFYLDYLNNYFTVDRYAEVKNLSVYECSTMLAAGKKLHEINCK